MTRGSAPPTPNLVSCPLITYQTPLAVRETSVCASLAVLGQHFAISRERHRPSLSHHAPRVLNATPGVFAAARPSFTSLKHYKSMCAACPVAPVPYLPEVAARRLGLALALALLAGAEIGTAWGRIAALSNGRLEFFERCSQIENSQDAPAASEPLTAKKHTETLSTR